MDDNKFCVYVHINKINKKLYIGQTCKKPKYRWANGNGYKGCIAFQNAIQKYGWDNFEHMILIDNLSIDESNIIEEYLIKKYQTNDKKYGYNLKSGGLNNLLSDETKEKIRLHNAKVNLGKHLSVETRRKLSKSHSGKKYSEDTNKKKGQSGKDNYFYGKSLKDSPNAKPVEMCDKNGGYIKTFSCAKEAMIETNIDSSCITKCCKLKRKTAGGFTWRYSTGKGQVALVEKLRAEFGMKVGALSCVE